MMMLTRADIRNLAYGHSWPKPVAEIYRKALILLNGKVSPLHFGPAHIVWEDANFESVGWCLDHFDEYRGDYSDDELAIVKQSLRELAALPDSVWDEYDNAIYTI